MELQFFLSTLIVLLALMALVVLFLLWLTIRSLFPSAHDKREMAAANLMQARAAQQIDAAAAVAVARMGAELQAANEELARTIAERDNAVERAEQAEGRAVAAEGQRDFAAAAAVAHARQLRAAHITPMYDVLSEQPNGHGNGNGN